MALPGKGLPPREIGPKGNRVMMLDIGTVKPDPNQPRPSFEFDGPDLAELAASIKKFGVLQPITVEPAEGAAQFRLIMGERRLRAAKLAGLTQIPALLGKVSAEQREVQQIHENLQRKAFSTEALVAAVEKLLAAGKKQAEIAEAFNVSKDLISRYATLAKTPPLLRNLARTVNSRPLYDLTKLHDRHSEAVASFVASTSPEDINHGSVAALAASLERPAVSASSDQVPDQPPLSLAASEATALPLVEPEPAADEAGNPERNHQGLTGSHRDPSASPDRAPSSSGLGGGASRAASADTKDDQGEEPTTRRKTGLSFKLFFKIGDAEMELDLAATALRQDGECVLLDALGEPVTAPIATVQLVEVRSV